MIRVLIADDHAIVREGLMNIMGPDMKVDTAASGAETLVLIRKKYFDVILLDISMPGMSGLETLKQIKTEKPDLPVLILSMHPEDQYALRCIKAGAAGYLTKACDKRELLNAIRETAAGKQYITPNVSEHMIEALRQPEPHKTTHEALSDREFQVFLLTAKGVALTDMAKRLNLSPKTISTYRRRILEKTGLRNNAEIMRYAFEHGLAEDSRQF